MQVITADALTVVTSNRCLHHLHLTNDTLHIRRKSSNYLLPDFLIGKPTPKFERKKIDIVKVEAVINSAALGVFVCAADS